MLSFVEAIPVDVLQAAVPWTWETVPEYMNVIGRRLGVNVGTLVGHSALRLYAMGEECSERAATEAELEVIGKKGIRRPTDPDLRVKDMERDGVDAEVIFGILGAATRLRDHEAATEMFRINNDWLVDFCDYWRRQCKATFQFDRIGTKLIDDIGVETLMWRSDYPHPDGVWPQSSRYIAEQFGHLPPDIVHKITCENARRFYGLI